MNQTHHSDLKYRYFGLPSGAYYHIKVGNQIAVREIVLFK